MFRLKADINKPRTSIVFVWSRNGAIHPKTFVKELLEPKPNIVGGAVSTDPPIAYITSVNVM